ncbi:MAG: 50S ribosomal protein L16 [Candidatus Ryanbacteria bacterium CG10_big_fil_rev_8_21_14_0_10_43_42]|uniref:Large ribosomal subunit protein uL16 n=1 Tax=Candidatus Ryanbacteria bacterium CG10_big_fil_rev_8_21_14_0_10_43_42 TaxID=1974864 RepID=A0A2M8KXZ5_9BACT|nr:MAG: 50S ribosomal protein L16 [Candidatus Ryanbacteria bacterium CG10_big_fil_rev_8_21_14_0_10_43_42]
MLVPKKVKHRKWQRGRSRGVETRGTTLAFGSFGLKALEPRWINSRQIESARRAMTRHMQRGGKLWIRIFPDKPITKRPPETTLGGGKGAPDHYVFPVRPGRILFEIDGVSEDIARAAFNRANAKLPIKTKVIIK